MPIAIIPVFQDIANVYQLPKKSFLILLYFMSSNWNVYLTEIAIGFVVYAFVTACDLYALAWKWCWISLVFMSYASLGFLSQRSG